MINDLASVHQSPASLNDGTVFGYVGRPSDCDFGS